MEETPDSSIMGTKHKLPKRSRSVLGTVNNVDDNELEYLEKIVLGTGSEIFEKTDSEDSDAEVPKKKITTEAKKPVWIDEDDNITFNEVVEKQGRRCTPGVSGSKKYQIIMEEKYKQVMGIPKWAQTSDSKTPVDELINRCGNFIKKSKLLGKGDIEYKKLKNLNCQTYVEGPFINVVKFHPKSTVAMVGGSSGIISIFQVDGKQNPKLQTLQFEKFPIFCGSFLKNGEEFLIGSQFQKYFYNHNLMSGHSTKVDISKMIDITKTKNFCVSPNDDIIAVCGNNGKIYLLAAKSKEYIDCLQMNCSVKSLHFNESGSLLYSHGEDGEVYIWNMNSRTCSKKFSDDGCLTGTSIAISRNDQFVACGSSSGVVNIYDSKKINFNENILPLKTIFNLVTPITNVQFNSSSEILAITSNFKKNAVRLVHCPSMTVFKNFPPFQSNIRKPMCTDFSPNSGYFAVGDDKGFAHLFRLKHFGNY